MAHEGRQIKDDDVIEFWVGCNPGQPPTPHRLLLMVEVFASLVGGGFDLVGAQVDQINGKVQAVRRGGCTRFLHR